MGSCLKGSPQGWPGSGSARADVAVRRLQRQPFTLLTPARLLTFDTGIVAPVFLADGIFITLQHSATRRYSRTAASENREGNFNLIRFHSKIIHSFSLGRAWHNLVACEGLRSRSVQTVDLRYLIHYVLESPGFGAIYNSRLRWHHSLLQHKSLQDGAPS